MTGGQHRQGQCDADESDDGECPDGPLHVRPPSKDAKTHVVLGPGDLFTVMAEVHRVSPCYYEGYLVTTRDLFSCLRGTDYTTFVRRMSSGSVPYSPVLRRQSGLPEPAGWPYDPVQDLYHWRKREESDE